MKWTKERKIYAGLLALGMAALGVDRLTRTVPDAAAAAAEDPASLVVAKPSASDPPPVPKAVPANKTAAPVVAPGVPLSERLRRAAGPSTRPSDKLLAAVDVFRPSRAWSPPPPPPPVPTTAPTPRKALPPPPDEVGVFRKSHRLTAVIVGRGSTGNRALIDGSTALRVGEALDDFRLVEVAHAQATFEFRDGRRVVLALEDAGGVVGAPRKVIANTDR
jgi:hypothetical protein